jgi:hypothetical protein
MESKDEMNKLIQYSNRFFDELEMFEDVARGHSYKSYIHQAILEFLENETKESAFAVYEAFFDSYRITLEGNSNPFIDLLDILRNYEETAATLISKQRDHYIHSVNVFILGLSIYSQNKNFRAAFDTSNLDKNKYPHSYTTKHEEFFYRWGIASLFHDVGYPVEIVGKQINKFMKFTTSIDQGEVVKTHLEFENFEEFNSIAEVLPKREFTRSYFEKYDSSVYIDLLKPIDLLSHKLHLSLGVGLDQIKNALDNFIEIMAQNGFIDHGFFSSIIVLKWYGFLIQSCNYKPDYFFHPILDSASAILLHNYYKNVIMKPPFNKSSLSPFEHPIAYLLILCDELQEWNREAYGILDKLHTHAGDASISISNDRLDVTYITQKTLLPDQFSSEKESILSRLLEMNSVFFDGFSIGCESIAELKGLLNEIKPGTSIKIRPLLENLEEIAIAIHDLYNNRQLELYPDKPLDYPNFSDLPDSLKYSNLRQARSMPEKLEMMGYEMQPIGSEGEIISQIPEEYIEAVARFEHGEWVQERLRSGWIYGNNKDVDKKISPYLVPYDELSDDIKERDRETIRNIPILLEMIGMAIYQISEEG